MNNKIKVEKNELLNILNTEIKFIGVDFDGTLINFEGSDFGSSWDLIGCQYYSKKEWDDVASFFLNRLLKEKDENVQEKLFVEWAERDAQVLKGKDASVFFESSFKLPYTKGAEEFFRSLNGTHYKAIISGGINILIEKAVKEMGFQNQISSIVHLDDKKRFLGTCEVKMPLHGKLDYTKKLIQKVSEETGQEIKPSQVCFIGDAINDLNVFKYLTENNGLTIAINPKTDELKKYSSIVIKDFTEVIGNK